MNKFHWRAVRFSAIITSGTARRGAREGGARHGGALIATFMMMMVLSGLAVAVGTFARNSVVGGHSQVLDKQAFFVSSAGLQRGRQQYIAGAWTAAPSPGNTYTETFANGVYDVTIIDNGDGTLNFISEAYIPNKTAPAVRRRLQTTPVVQTGGADTNLSTQPGVAATASSGAGSHEAGDAVDGNYRRRWQAIAGPQGAWLALDYGSPVTVDKAIVWEMNTHMQQFSIQTSADGISWTNVSNQVATSSPSPTFPNRDVNWTVTWTSVTTRYLRLEVTQMTGEPKIWEFETYNTQAGSGGLSPGDTTTQW